MHFYFIYYLYVFYLLRTVLPWPHTSPMPASLFTPHCPRRQAETLSRRMWKCVRWAQVAAPSQQLLANSSLLFVFLKLTLACGIGLSNICIYIYWGHALYVEKNLLVIVSSICAHVRLLHSLSSFSETVERIDVSEAVALIRSALQQAATDPRTGVCVCVCE